MIGGPPRLGHIIRYVYDWSEDYAAESPSAEKERPAVIILTVRRDGDRILVRVAPITHRPPADPGGATEIPGVTKARLGLDGERSWIILDHANEFLWPGPDVRPVPGKEPATIYWAAAAGPVWQGQGATREPAESRQAARKTAVSPVWPLRARRPWSG